MHACGGEVLGPVSGDVCDSLALRLSAQEACSLSDVRDLRNKNRCAQMRRISKAQRWAVAMAFRHWFDSVSAVKIVRAKHVCIVRRKALNLEDGVVVKGWDGQMID